MTAKRMLLASAGMIAIAATAVLALGLRAKAPANGITYLGKPVSFEQIALGQEIYAKSCASCHGANLEGQPNWKRRLENGRMPAPPHNEGGHSWHHSDRNLFTITKFGVGAVVPGYESDMPVFRALLTDDEIVEVLAFIKSTWAEREREFQAELTANDEGER